MVQDLDHVKPTPQVLKSGQRPEGVCGSASDVDDDRVGAGRGMADLA